MTDHAKDHYEKNLRTMTMFSRTFSMYSCSMERIVAWFRNSGRECPAPVIRSMDNSFFKSKVSENNSAIPEERGAWQLTNK